jgi:hypothetical protein
MKSATALVAASRVNTRHPYIMALVRTSALCIGKGNINSPLAEEQWS